MEDSCSTSATRPKEARWLLPNSFFLKQTPSRLKGTPYEEENASLCNYCNFIQDLGQGVEVNQLCINTACVFLRRIFTLVHLRRFPCNYKLATAALFLAAKAEEKARKLSDLITYKIRLAGYDPKLNFSNCSTTQEKDTYEIAQTSEEYKILENAILKLLGFEVTIEHPHKYVVVGCHMLKTSTEFAQTAYFLATHTLQLTNLCVMYRATTIAALCIFLASKWSRYEIPPSLEGKQWYEYIDKDLAYEDMDRMAKELMKQFEQCPDKLKRNLMSHKLKKGDEPDRKRPRMDGPSSTMTSSSQNAAGPSGMSNAFPAMAGTSGSSGRSRPPAESGRFPHQGGHHHGMVKTSSSSASSSSSNKARVGHGDIPRPEDQRSGDMRRAMMKGDPGAVAAASYTSTDYHSMKMEPGAGASMPEDKKPGHVARAHPNPPQAKKLSLHDYQQRVEQRPPPATQVKTEAVQNPVNNPPPAIPVTHSTQPLAPQLPHSKYSSHGAHGAHQPYGKHSSQPHLAGGRDSGHGRLPHGQAPHPADSSHGMYSKDPSHRQAHGKHPAMEQLAQVKDSKSPVKSLRREGSLGSAPESAQLKDTKVSVQDLQLKEAKVMVQDLKDSQGQDHVMYTNAEAVRRRSGSQSREDDIGIKDAPHHHSRLPHGSEAASKSRKTLKASRRSSPRSSAPDAEADKVGPIRLTLKRDAGTLQVKNAGGHDPASKLSPASQKSSPSLKMKIRMPHDTSKRNSSWVSGEGEESLKLRLPVPSSSSGGGHDRHGHQGGHTSSHSSDKRNRISRSQTYLPTGQAMGSHSRDRLMHRSSSSSQLDPPPPPPSEKSRPSLSLQTQHSGFSFPEQFITPTVPELIFEPDTPTDANGLSFGAPETPTLDNMHRVNAHMQQLFAQRTGQQMPSYPNPHLHQGMVNSVYRPAQPPLPPPLPDNPPPPPPPPPQ